MKARGCGSSHEVFPELLQLKQNRLHVITGLLRIGKLKADDLAPAEIWCLLATGLQIFHGMAKLQAPARQQLEPVYA